MKNNKHPLRVVVFCSGSASSLRWLWEHDPNCGVKYEFVGVFADTLEATGLEYAKGLSIPTKVLTYLRWCAAREANPKDLVAREAYFKEVLWMIELWQPDIIMLSGFMLIITEPLLSALRVLNIHPADLRIEQNGLPKYRGLYVVKRAMADSAPTASTVHLVTKEVDGGPIISVSDPLPYAPGDDPGAHQEQMKSVCDGPAYAEALHLIATGAFKFPLAS